MSKRQKVKAPPAATASAPPSLAKVPEALKAQGHQQGPTFVVPNLTVTEHTFQVPLWYAAPTDKDGSAEAVPRIQLFLREVTAAHKINSYTPYLLYLQGGPGFEAPRPTEASAWLKAAVTHFRVILMDQRGTGQSTPVTAANLARHGDAAAQAAYLAHFRADNIVRDAELVRRAMVPACSQEGRWSVLGQSFGGFCALTYLSMHPEGLAEVFLTGGLPPCIALPCGAEAAYRALAARVLTQNAKFYARFPDDVPRVQRLVLHLAALPAGGAPLPSGGLLSPRGVQMLGLAGLGAGGGFERLHYLLERAFDGDQVSAVFLKGFEAWVPWDTNPLYALLHEPCYAAAPGAAPAWAAARVLATEYGPQFDAVACARAGLPVNFTGEMVFPWMFEEVAALRPLRATADLLAARADWPPLYEPEALAANTVPVAAATYFEDMYVDFDLAQDTARRVRGLRQWVTSEYQHSGIRDDGARIFEHLFGMLHGALPLN